MFKVPTDGYYEVSASVYTYEPTGNMIERDNYQRKWFQFWKPKTVMVPEFKVTKTNNASEIKLLRSGTTGHVVLRKI